MAMKFSKSSFPEFPLGLDPGSDLLDPQLDPDPCLDFCFSNFSLGVDLELPMVFKVSLAALVVSLSLSNFKDLPYLPLTYINKEL